MDSFSLSGWTRITFAVAGAQITAHMARAVQTIVELAHATGCLHVTPVFVHLQRFLTK